MAGFQVPRKTYRLTFADADMAGLVVRCHSIPMGGLLDVVAMSGRVGGSDMALDMETIGKLFERFAGALVSWNLTEGDEPVPADLAGVRSLDLDFAMTIVGAWIEATASVPDPLAKRSTDGPVSLAASMPMEILSPSLLS